MLVQNSFSFFPFVHRLQWTSRSNQIDENSFGGMKVQGINDVCTSKDGRIFLVDTLETAILEGLNSETPLIFSGFSIVRLCT